MKGASRGGAVVGARDKTDGFGAQDVQREGGRERERWESCMQDWRLQRSTKVTGRVYCAQYGYLSVQVPYGSTSREKLLYVPSPALKQQPRSPETADFDTLLARVYYLILFVVSFAVMYRLS